MSFAKPDGGRDLTDFRKAEVNNTKKGMPQQDERSRMNSIPRANEIRLNHGQGNLRSRTVFF